MCLIDHVTAHRTMIQPQQTNRNEIGFTFWRYIIRYNTGQETFKHDHLTSGGWRHLKDNYRGNSFSKYIYIDHWVIIQIVFRLFLWSAFYPRQTPLGLASYIKKIWNICVIHFLSKITRKHFRLRTIAKIQLVYMYRMQLATATWFLYNTCAM